MKDNINSNCYRLCHTGGTLCRWYVRVDFIYLFIWSYFIHFGMFPVCECLSFASAAGIVRTSVIVTGVQVCSRIYMVWFITSSIRQVNIHLIQMMHTIYFSDLWVSVSSYLAYSHIWMLSQWQKSCFHWYALKNCLLQWLECKEAILSTFSKPLQFTLASS